MLLIGLQIAVIALLSLSDSAVYIQASALAFTTKLNIEIRLAELLGKVVKKSGRPKTSLTDVEACPAGVPARREWVLQKSSLVRKCRRASAHICCHHVENTGRNSEPGPGQGWWGRDEKVIASPPRAKPPPLHSRASSEVISAQPAEDVSCSGCAATELRASDSGWDRPGG